jgi:preprotein translocase subunit YajC
MQNVWIVAQADGNQAVSRISSKPVGTSTGGVTTVPDRGVPGPAQPPSKSPAMIQLVMLLAMVALMYFVLFRGPKKKQQEHKKMLDSLEKNDRVCTIGGIFGTVVEVKGEEVILKVDESSNTKLRVRASAIAANLAKENQNP